MSERWRTLLAIAVLILFLCWAIPTCIRGPVSVSKSSMQEYMDKLEKAGYKIKPVDTSGIIGITITSPDGTESWGLGIGCSSGSIKVKE